MPIPNLLNFQDGNVLINPKFIDFNEFTNWSPQRQIEVIYKLVKDSIYWNSNFTEEKIEKSMQWFNWAYWLAKLKFQDIKRNTGWRYFDHLINVMQYVVINSKNPTIKKTIIAICHDLIEDTDISFWTLREVFWTHIALWVLLISKSPIRNYVISKWTKNLNEEEKEKIIKSWVKNNWRFISKIYLEKKYNSPEEITTEEIEAENLFLKSINDFQLFEMIELCWILNFKWIISDEFYQKETYEPEKVTPEEKWAKELYKKLDKKYKDLRNAEYFSHMLSENLDSPQIYNEEMHKNTPCLNKFYNHALSVRMSPNLKIKIRLSENEIKQICLDAIEVKFWDRIDNLKSTEIYTINSKENIAKAKRKIAETKKYFYEISKEFDYIMWTKFNLIIKNEVEKLENFIKNNNINNTVLSTKNSASNAIKKP